MGWAKTLRTSAEQAAPHWHRELLIGWFAGAAWPQRLGMGRVRTTGGQELSTRYPLLRALARRADWVLMGMSPPVDGHPAPTPAVLLSSEVGFFLLPRTCRLPYIEGTFTYFVLYGDCI
jgi:hypothetical protein